MCRKVHRGTPSPDISLIAGRNMFAYCTHLPNYRSVALARDHYNRCRVASFPDVTPGEVFWFLLEVYLETRLAIEYF